MLRRSFIAAGALALAAGVLGCAPQWQVIVQAAPDPFLGQRKFAVLPVDFAGLRVGEKPEPVYLAEKDAKQQASFAEDKAALNEKFFERLRVEAHDAGIDIVPATGPADAPFLIKPSVSFVEPGFYGVVVSKPSMVEMTVRIVAPDGRILDEIALHHGTSPRSGVSVGGIPISNMASGSRLRTDGEELGKIVGRYLQARVGG